MNVALWGQRALEFNADQVIADSQDTTQIIFVGMLVKPYEGTAIQHRYAPIWPYAYSLFLLGTLGFR